MITSFAQLIDRTQPDTRHPTPDTRHPPPATRHPPLATVLVWPLTPTALRSAVEAQERGLAACTLVGDVDAMRSLAGEAAVDLASVTLLDQPDVEQALQQAVHLCRQGQAAVLVNEGAPLHLIVETLQCNVSTAQCNVPTAQCNVSTISGISVLDWQEQGRLLLLTDGHVIVSPDLEQRVALIENAIWVAGRLGIEQPRVALIAAAETVNPKSRVSVDAAQITVMARRGQIGGASGKCASHFALVDGPLGFDNAVSAHAAQVKGIHSEVAGRADVLVAPDLEAGSLLLKTLASLCQLPAASLIVGGCTPVVLWSPADAVQSRLAGLALGAICSRR